MPDSLPSFVGLTILLGDPDAPLEVTTVEDAEEASRIRTSLKFRLQCEDPAGHQASSVGVFIIYGPLSRLSAAIQAEGVLLGGKLTVEEALAERLGIPGTGSSVEAVGIVNQLGTRLAVRRRP